MSNKKSLAEIIAAAKKATEEKLEQEKIAPETKTPTKKKIVKGRALNIYFSDPEIIKFILEEHKKINDSLPADIAPAGFGVVIQRIIKEYLKYKRNS